MDTRGAGSEDIPYDRSSPCQHTDTLTRHIPMVIFNIAGFLTDFTDGHSQINLDSSPATVGEALVELWEMHVGLRDRVLNEQGHVRAHVNVFVNNENIRRNELLDTTLSGPSEITILPSVSGGEHCIVPQSF